MDFLTTVLHHFTSGAAAYLTTYQMGYSQTRPNLLAGFQLAESGSVPFFTALSTRAAEEGDFWLSQKLARHAADENRHGQIFAHGLKQLGKQVIDRQSLAQQEQEHKKDPDKKSNSFYATYFAGYTPTDLKAENIDWLVFMGSTHILELDASRDFLLMTNALKDSDRADCNLKTGILSIAKDETRHAAYLLEAMERRFGSSITQKTVDEWRTRKVNALMAMLNNAVAKSGAIPNLAEDIQDRSESLAEKPLASLVNA